MRSNTLKRKPVIAKAILRPELEVGKYYIVNNHCHDSLILVTGRTPKCYKYKTVHSMYKPTQHDLYLGCRIPIDDLLAAGFEVSNTEKLLRYRSICKECKGNTINDYKDWMNGNTKVILGKKVLDIKGEIETFLHCI